MHQTENYYWLAKQRVLLFDFWSLLGPDSVSSQSSSVLLYDLNEDSAVFICSPENVLMLKTT